MRGLAFTGSEEVKAEQIKYFVFYSICALMFMYYTVCYFIGISYAIVRHISTLFVDNKDSVFCACVF